MFELDNNTIIAIGALIVTVVSVVLAITRGTAADKAVTVALRALQSNDEAMRRYEDLYNESAATTRRAFDAVTDIVKAFAPLTPWEADDALGEVMDDVRTPGKPDAA